VKRLRFIHVLSTILVAGFLYALGVEVAPIHPTGEVIRVGVNDSPPYVFVRPDGTVGGFSFEMLNEAGRRRGIVLQWIVAPEGPDVALKGGNVDLWHVMTDIPERHQWAYYTDPYLRVNFVLTIPAHGAIQRPEDMDGRRLSHDKFTLDASLARRFFPRSTYLPRTRGEELDPVCNGKADAAFVSFRETIVQLLHRSPACDSVALEIMPIEGATFQMGIGASRKGLRAATELRAEITNMAQDHSLDALYRKYLHDTTNETQVVNELIFTRQRSRLFRYSAGVLAIVVALLGVLIYRERAVRRAVKTAYEFASAVLDRAGGLVYICDRHGRIVRFNRACERATGKKFAEVRQKNICELFVPPEERAGVQSMFAQLAGGVAHTNHEHHWQTREGPRLFSWSNTVLVDKSGRVDYIIATGIDITNREATEQRLGYEATHDALTALVNRRQFLRELDAAFAAAKSGGAGFTLVLADLDHFKVINDSHGHDSGDEVLTYFARVLRYELAPCDLAGRLGGDEFCLVIRSAGVTTILERIRTHLMDHEFRSLAGRTFHSTVTFGLAAWCDSISDPVALLRAADQCLYVAKGRNPDRLAPFEAELVG
jgi:diguanylate cyclase (GGDEF)-like protein/PAS domain S-box-containing protein